MMAATNSGHEHWLSREVTGRAMTHREEISDRSKPRSSRLEEMQDERELHEYFELTRQDVLRAKKRQPTFMPLCQCSLVVVLDTRVLQ